MMTIADTLISDFKQAQKDKNITLIGTLSIFIEQHYKSMTELLEITKNEQEFMRNTIETYCLSEIDKIKRSGIL
jgi:hypothetical protein